MNETLDNIAYKKLKEQIVSTEIMPQTLISVNEIASQMGISRTPLHRAITRLEQEGFLTIVKNKGCMVKEVSALDTYFTLETIVLLLRSVFSDPNLIISRLDMYLFKSNVTDCIKALEKGDYISYVHSVDRCFEAIVSLNQNPYFQDIYKRTSAVWIRASIYSKKLLPDQEAYTLDELLQNIYASLQNNAPAAATKHLDNYYVNLKKRFEP